MTDKTAANEIERLTAIMAQLRDPETGCPWDIAQDFSSIAPYTIEEAYEVADAIARQNRADLCEELGDLLLQVVFHARMAEEEGSFSFADVARAINAKLMRRHPHVFGTKAERAARQNPAAIKRQWAVIKAQENAAKTVAAGKSETKAYLDSVSANLPAALEAEKLQNQAEKIGFDWAEPLPVLAKLREELQELEEALAEGKQREAKQEFGDVLFTAINLGRKIEANFEMSLRAVNQKFRYRFGYIEAALNKQNKSLAEADLAAMEALWQEAKQAET